MGRFEIQRSGAALLARLVVGLTSALLQAQAPEIVLQNGHVSQAGVLAFRADGKVLASGGSDSSVKLWDSATGLEIRSLGGHEYATIDLAWHPDSKHLAVATEKQIWIWDTSTGERVQRILVPSILTSADYNADGTLLATAAADGAVRIHDQGQQQSRARSLLGHEGDVHLLAFDPEQPNLLASGDESGLVLVWDLDQVRPQPKARLREEGMTSMAWRRSRTVLATLNVEEITRFWDLETGAVLEELVKPRSRYQEQPISFGRRIEIAENGWLAMASSDARHLGDEVFQFTGNFRVWDPRRKRWIFDRVEIGDEMPFALSSDGRILALASGSQVKIVDVPSGEDLHVSYAGTLGRNCCVAFHPELPILAVAGSSGVVLWNLKEGRVLAQLKTAIPWTEQLAFSPDGERLVVGASKSEGFQGEEAVVFSQLELWDWRRGRKHYSTPELRGRLSGLVFSPDGRYLATSDFYDLNSLDEIPEAHPSQVVLWDAASGSRINQILEVFEDPVTALTFHPRGKSLAVGIGEYSGEVRIVDHKSGEIMHSLMKDENGSRLWSIDTLSFSPDGTTIATRGAIKHDDEGSRYQLLLWRPGSGQIRSLPGHEKSILATVFHPKENILISAGGDHKIKLWDLESGAEVATLDAHAGAVNDLALGFDGNLLASASDDGTARLWRTDDPDLLTTLISPRSGEHLILTKEGFYSATRGAWHAVGFRLLGRAFPFEQFDLHFNRPDLVLQRLGFADPAQTKFYHELYQRRLQRMNVQAPPRLDAIGTLPTVELLDNLPKTTGKRHQDLRVRLEAGSRSITKLGVFVNDVPVYGTYSKSFITQPIDGSRELTVRVELSQGQNRIQVSAINEEGLESIRETAFVRYIGKKHRPDLYFVAIGISAYRESRQNLRFAAQDAKDLIRYFAGLGNSFATIHPMSVLDQDAESSALPRIHDMLRSANVDDHVILFFSGHGLLDADFRYYFATHSTDFDRPAETGLPYEEIQSLLDEIPPRHKLLLLDTCFAGEVDRPARGSDARSFTLKILDDESKVTGRALRGGRILVPESIRRQSSRLFADLFADLRRSTGTVVIAAAGGLEYAIEGEEWSNGVFTHAVLQALEERLADFDGDGRVTVSELREFVVEKVDDLTGGRQRPRVRQDNLAIDFAVDGNSSAN